MQLLIRPSFFRDEGKSDPDFQNEKALESLCFRSRRDGSGTRQTVCLATVNSREEVNVAIHQSENDPPTCHSRDTVDDVNPTSRQRHFLTRTLSRSKIEE